MGEAVEIVSKGMKTFINNFHKLLDVEDENYVASAFSAHLVLSMTAYGAGEKTAAEMRKTLCLPDDDSEALKAFETIILNCNRSKEMEEGMECIFEIANKIYPADSFTIKDSFKNVTRKFFQSECQTLNFEKNTESAATVNNWCSEKTHDKIKTILDPDELPEDTKLILVNAVYFKGIWNLQFDDYDTKPSDFHINTSTTVQVPTMSIKDDFRYKELKELNAQSIVLYFKDDNNYMEIIVPNDIDGLSAIEKNLDKTTLTDEEHRLCKVNFEMPKFKIETALDLKDHLQKMGMATMFDSDEANFSNMTDKSIFVNQVKQKAFIQVDEWGCEAAAVTCVVCVEMCAAFDDEVKLEIIDLKADRPFLFRIYDHVSRTFIFVGRVTNPVDD